MFFLLPVSSNRLSFSRSLSSTFSIALMGVVGVSDTFKHHVKKSNTVENHPTFPYTTSLLTSSFLTESPTPTLVSSSCWT